jgi:hypothetical protein
VCQDQHERASINSRTQAMSSPLPLAICGRMAACTSGYASPLKSISCSNQSQLCTGSLAPAPKIGSRRAEPPKRPYIFDCDCPMDDYLWDIICKCTRVRRKDRCSADDLIHELQARQAALVANPRIGLGFMTQHGAYIASFIRCLT